MAGRVGITVWVVYPLTFVSIDETPLLPKLFTDRNDAIDYMMKWSKILEKQYPDDGAHGRRMGLCEQDI